MRDTRTGFPAGKPDTTVPLRARRPAAVRPRRRSGSHRRRPAVPAGLALAAVLSGLILVAVTVMGRSGPAAPPAGPPPGPLAQSPASLGAVSWPEAGVSAADITGLGVVAGAGARRPGPLARLAQGGTGFLVL